MWKHLILCLFGIIGAVNVQSKVITAGEATKADVESLVAITEREILPVILFATEGSLNLQNLQGLRQAEIINGRLTSGTEFYAIAPYPQMFFCPKLDPISTKKCLVPTYFGESEILQCQRALEPVLRPTPEEMYCGAHFNGHFLLVGYEICPATLPYTYKDKYTGIYEVCYSEMEEKILFASYSINAAQMLREDLLIREQEVDFHVNINKDDELHSYYSALLSEILQNPAYGVQTLVPIKDMPLASMRKTAVHYSNYALQYISFRQIWDEIREHIRNHAIKMNNQIFEIMTGVFDIPKNKIPTNIGKNQMATIWVTLIRSKFQGRESGLAIVMNNFINEEHIGTSKQSYIVTLCPDKNLCVESLKYKFARVKGEVRCCQLTQNIMNLFFYSFQFPTEMELIEVDYINK